jgi:LacI family transcriptional regulator, galactose operon repressor
MYSVAGVNVYVIERKVAPTIHEVARAARVSIATVSRVINGLNAGYTKETRDRVLRVVDKLGYAPNTIARTMITRKTGAIGVLVPDLSSMFSAHILRGIEECSLRNGRNVFVSHTESNGRRTLDYLKVLYEKRIDGVIFLSEVLRPEYRAYLEKHSIPVVLLATRTPAGDIPYVKVDDRAASYDGVSALIGLGHRSIGMLSGSMEDPIAGAPRVEGYRSALADHGIRVDDSLIIDAHGFHFGCVEQAGSRIDPLLSRVTAFFCASDELAAGLLNHVIRRGLDVPGSMSILGYDDLPITTMVIPSLSTIRQPLVEMGDCAAMMLLDLVDSAAGRKQQVFPHTVVLRESTRDLGKG